jgi:hypothetical protein
MPASPPPQLTLGNTATTAGSPPLLQSVVNSTLTWRAYNSTTAAGRVAAVAFTREPSYKPMQPLAGTAKATPTRATAVLIRTGANESAYSGLLSRNAAIARRRWAANVDHLIFHDGTLPPAHAAYIRAHSPGLQHGNGAATSTASSSLQFVSAQPTFDRARRAMLKVKPNGYCKPTPISKRFHVGYKAMCWFWFKDMLGYSEVLKYGELLRIDDDCYLSDSTDGVQATDAWPSAATAASTATKTASTSLSPTDASGDVSRNDARSRRRAQDSTGGGTAAAPLRLVSPLASVADEGMDNKATTMGLRQAFAELNGSIFQSTWRSPYTNVLLYNITYLSQSDALARVYQKVSATGCVWVNRWGDSPLWGATRLLLAWPAPPLVGLGGYEHGSHGMVHVAAGLVDYAHRPGAAKRA